jgi:hypothetical protein
MEKQQEHAASYSKPLLVPLLSGIDFGTGFPVGKARK